MIEEVLPELVTAKLTNKQIAERATIQSFLNCYLRETGNGKRLEISSDSDLATKFFERPDSKELIYCNLSDKESKY